MPALTLNRITFLPYKGSVSDPISLAVTPSSSTENECHHIQRTILQPTRVNSFTKPIGHCPPKRRPSHGVRLR